MYKKGSRSRYRHHDTTIGSLRAEIHRRAACSLISNHDAAVLPHPCTSVGLSARTRDPSDFHDRAHSLKTPATPSPTWPSGARCLMCTLTRPILNIHQVHDPVVAPGQSGTLPPIPTHLAPGILIHPQRLAKWFTTLSPKDKAKIIKDVSQLVLARRTRMCNFLEYKGR